PPHPPAFPVKLYTQQGNYHILANHLPLFFIPHPIKFPHILHSLKPPPHTNIQTPHPYSHFVTLTPQSTHIITSLFS
ncbi:catalase, partial [Bacillus thuringiensis]|uniref:catalase n=1 Tax=Bacillus thuringiensis TaxID=1428 RepID=UPI0011A2E027